MAVPDWGGVAVPNRGAWGATRAKLAKTDRHRVDSPHRVALADIREAPELFQPRFDSIAFAPGRSEAHVAELKQVLLRGEDLDAVSIVAFGRDWFLVDGHHRLAAYRSTGRAEPIPVRVEHSEAQGDSRVRWAVELSCGENKKSRLSMSREDKMDAAWRAGVSGAEASKAEVAKLYGIGTATVGNMRAALRDLREDGVSQCELERMSWRNAQSKRRARKGTGPDGDWSDRQARILAKKLKPAMAAKPSASQLAAALEAYSPGIVRAMQMAQEMELL